MTAPHHDSAAWLEVVFVPGGPWHHYRHGKRHDGTAPSGLALRLESQKVNEPT